MESSTLINNWNITSTYVFISQTGRPAIWAWEVITIENIFVRDKSKVLVVDLSKKFYRMYERELEGYGINKEDIQYVNLASNDQYLVLNYKKADRFMVYVFCGLQAHYDRYNQKCENHDPGFINLDLPSIFDQKPYRNLEESSLMMVDFPTARGYSVGVYRCN
jgi:hypothetical protein